MRDSNGPLEKDRLKDYEFRIVVSGTRGFDDEKVFDENVRKYLKDLGIAGDENKHRVCFIAGEVRAGAGIMIEAWCAEHGYAFIKFKPAWNDIDVEGAVVRDNGRGKQYNALAGYWCNEEMAEVANYLITFYDGVSSDTQDLMTRMTDKHNPCRVILVHVEKDKDNHGWKS